MSPTRVGRIPSDAAGKYYKKAIQLYRSDDCSTKDLKKAGELLTLALSGCPNNAKYFNARGNILRSLGEYQRAFFDFSNAIDLEPNSALYLSNRASTLKHLNRIDIALVDLNKAVKLEPNNFSLRLSRGQVYYETKQYEDAVKDFTYAIKDKKTAFRAHSKRGVCYRLMGLYEESIKDLKHAAEIQPDNHTLLNSLGTTCIEMGENRLALEMFQTSVRLCRNEAVYLNNLALALYNLKNYEKALTTVELAIRYNGDTASFYTNRGNIQLALGNYVKSQSDFERALSFDPNSADTYYSLGLLFQNLSLQPRDAKRALDYFKNAAAINKRHIQSKYHSGLMYHRLQKYDLAIDSFSQVLEQKPDDVLALESRGLVHQDNGSYMLAMSDFTKSIELDDKNPINYLNRGNLNVLLGKTKQALKDLNMAVSLAENQIYPEIWSARGMCRRTDGDVNGALDDISMAIKLTNERTSERESSAEKELINRKQAELLYNRSLCWLDQDDPSTAERDLTAAIRIDANLTKLLGQRGWVRLISRRFKPALEDLNLYAGLVERKLKPLAYYRLGITYANLNDNENAIKQYSKALKLFTDSNVSEEKITDQTHGENENVSLSEIYHERAKAFQLVGKHENAIEDFSKVVDSCPRNAHAFFRRAFSYKAVRNFDRAASDFQKAKQLDPENPNMVINYRDLKATRVIVLCEPGREKVY